MSRPAGALDLRAATADGTRVSSGPHRRAVLRAGLTVVGAALAGCSRAPTGGGLPHASGTEPELPPLVRRSTVGAWAAGPGDLAADHLALEDLVGARLPVASWYADWDTPWTGALQQAARRLLRAGDHEVLLSWEGVGIYFPDVLEGYHDAYLTAFLTALDAHPGPVLVRPFAEMNGPWQTWSLDHPERLARDPATWTATWRHLVALGRRLAPRVRWVFCVNTTDEGTVPMEEYWPGADWVDLVGIDGYNWGFAADGTPLSTVEQVVGPMYERLLDLHPASEVALCETGCAEGEGKAAWLQDLFGLTRFPRLTRLVLFHEDKERDWRLDSDPAALAATRRALQGSAGA